MSGTRATEVPAWLRVAVWSLAIGVAVIGAVLAAVTSSLWPLVAFAGLAVPMFPIGTPRTARGQGPRG